MNVPGSAPLAHLLGQRQQMDETQRQQEKIVKFMQSAMESCPTKTAMAGVGGFALGGMFGLFMSSMRYDAPGSFAGPNSAAQQIADLPIRQQLRVGLKDMGRSSLSSARNFGFIGSIFAGVECCIEGLRAKNDLANSAGSGCITGALLARAAGPQAMCVGCLGFAAFSTAIDTYMRQPGESTGGRID